jgi:hypothetical protein
MDFEPCMAIVNIISGLKVRVVHLATNRHIDPQQLQEGKTDHIKIAEEVGGTELLSFIIPPPGDST